MLRRLASSDVGVERKGPRKQTVAALFLIRASAGLFALGLGVSVYVADRETTFVLPWANTEWLRLCVRFGVLAQWLPSFFHVLAFSLLTATVLAREARPPYGACVAWCAVNMAFEVGQHPALGTSLANIANGLGAPPFLGRYFVYGTFDIADLAATAIGALLAAVALRLTHCPSGERSCLSKDSQRRPDA